MKKALTIITAAAMITVSAASVSAQDVQTEQSPSTYTQLIGASVGRVTVKSSYSSSSSAVRIKWNKVSGASGYRIYRQDAEGNWKKIKTITKSNITEYRDSGLTAGTRYRYKVKAYKKSDGKTTWGKASEPKLTATKPSAVKFGSFSATQTAIRLNWTPVECEGYQIYQKIAGKYVKIDTIRDKNTATYKVNGLNAETKYSFKIRAFSKDGAGKVIYTPFVEKVKTTKGVEWTEVDKAYYHMCLGYPTNRECELVRKDICDYIMNNYGDKENLQVDISAYRVFHTGVSESFNPATMKFEKELTGASYQISDAHIEHCIDLWDWVGAGITPMKNGYNMDNYKAIQEAKQEIYDYLGYDAIFNTYISNEDYSQTPMLFNIGIEYAPHSATYVGGDGDYYDNKDPWDIPQYTLWFCNIPPLSRD